jgi:hypothetical protein
MKPWMKLARTLAVCAAAVLVARSCADAWSRHSLARVHVAQAQFVLGGTQWFYVVHVRGCPAAAWAESASEPTTTASIISVPRFQFVDGARQRACGVGDIVFLCCE